MAYKITYNGFGSEGGTNTKWSNIRISNYSSRPLFSDDGQTHWTTQHTMSGTALLVVNDGLLTSIDECRTKLSKVGRNLVIKEGSTTISDVGNNDFDKTDGLALPYGNSDGAEYNFAGNTDQVGFPRCEFEINEFYGTANAMVSFTFTWVESKNDGDASEDLSYSVLSHVWKQSFSISEGGLQTWKINGTLRIRPYAPAGVAGSADLGRNPDSYRSLVMPSLPPTFRIKSMEWATNNEGDTLLYTLVCQEHSRRLPSPAKRGSGTFTFKKMLDSGAGLLGIKTFEAELEGGVNAKTTDLLASLLDASTKRIQWTGPKKDLVTSLAISERDIFSKKIISLRVTAQGLDANVESQLRGQGANSELNFGILSDFVTEDNIAKSGSAWGDALICSFKRQMFIPYAGYEGDGDFPKAQLMTMPDSPHEGSTNITGGVNNQGTVIEDIYELDNIPLEDSKPVITPKDKNLLGDEFGEDAQSPDAIANKYMNVTGVERVTVQHNIAVTSTNAIYSKHIPITTSPPDIFVTSEYTLTRSGEPPPMLHFGVNRNHITVDEETAVTAGEIDASGNRVYTRTINRTLRYLYGHGGGGIDESQTIPVTYYMGDATLTLYFNNPVGYIMSRPFDPRTDSETDIEYSTIWNPSSSFGETYELDFSVPVGQI